MEKKTKSSQKKVFLSGSLTISILFLLISFMPLKHEYFEIMLPITNSERIIGNELKIKVIGNFPKTTWQNQKGSYLIQIFPVDFDQQKYYFKEDESLDSSDPVVVNIEIRLELPGIRVEPPGLLSQNLLNGKMNYFNWTVNPFYKGSFDGTLWVYANLISRNGSERIIHEVLLARPVHIEVITIFGLSKIWIRIFLVILIISSLYLRFKLILNKK